MRTGIKENGEEHQRGGKRGAPKGATRTSASPEENRRATRYYILHLLPSAKPNLQQCYADS